MMEQEAAHNQHCHQQASGEHSRQELVDSCPESNARYTSRMCDEHEHHQGAHHEHENHDSCSHERQELHPLPKAQQGEMFEVQEHEGALVVSVERTIRGRLDALCSDIEEALGTISTWVKEQGGTVGHIKASVCSRDVAISFSCTGGPVERQVHDKGACQFIAAIIVFGVSQEKLEEVIRKALPE